LIALFIFSWIFIGNYIIFNLFVSIILDSFSIKASEEEVHDFLPESFKMLQSTNNRLKKKIDKGTISNLLANINNNIYYIKKMKTM